MSKFIPYGKVLLVRPIKGDEKTEGGIYKPDSAQEVPTSGEVLESNTLEFKIGETVVYRKYSGLEWEVDGEKLLILPIENVVGWKKE